MRERSELIMDTVSGEAPCAEPLVIGGTSGVATSACRRAEVRHR